MLDRGPVFVRRDLHFQFTVKKVEKENHEIVDHICLVALSYGVQVDSRFWPCQSKPAIQRVDWYHPEDSDDVFLKVGLCIIQNVLNDFPKCDRQSQENEDTTAEPCLNIGARTFVHQFHTNEWYHDQYH